MHHTPKAARLRQLTLRGVVVGAILTLAGGCASNPFGEPIVDMQGVDPVMYQTDLAECRSYADEVAVATRAGAGAVTGAVVGGLIGAAVGDSDSAQRSAGAGAVVGGAEGGIHGVQERSVVVRNCLRNRGYSVLN